jgi:hypothetical protein
MKKILGPTAQAPVYCTRNNFIVTPVMKFFYRPKNKFMGWGTQAWSSVASKT